MFSLVNTLYFFPLQTLPTQTPPGQQNEEEDADSSSYTGMATALANAIKERRQHISDKSEWGWGNVNLEGEEGRSRDVFSRPLHKFTVR